MKEKKAWALIAHCGDIPLREGRAVKVAGREIAIFNLGENFLAVENRCPHKAGPLADGIVSGTTVACPLHAWKFSLETGKGASSASASSCVQTFRTIVEDGIVLVELRKDLPNAEEAHQHEIRTICMDSIPTAAVNDLPLGG
jgi:nitrite reductase (NADH) small subunit